MSESEPEKDKAEFCLFCDGTGKMKDLILLREEPCKHCQGKGQ